MIVTSKYETAKIKVVNICNTNADAFAINKSTRFLESRHYNQEINLLELHRLLLSLLVIGMTSSCMAFIMEHVIFNYNKWKNRPKYPYLP